MPLLNKLFGKSKSAVERVEVPKKAEPVKKVAELKPDGALLSPLATEKAVSGQSLNKYVFKIAYSANKIEVAKAVGKNYNVKVVSVNIINIPRKARRVGKTQGFKSGYKKAIVTLAKGQTIEIK
ncbi:MAG: 50S ribosomal protein L23 [Parcubacteria group bacterium]|nr:50S ribosomal protein L23 [Parcubacteria group bacterium]